MLAKTADRLEGIGPEILEFYPYETLGLTGAVHTYYAPILDGNLLFTQLQYCDKPGYIADWVRCPYLSLVEDWLLEAVVAPHPAQFWAHCQSCADDIVKSSIIKDPLESMLGL